VRALARARVSRRWPPCYRRTRPSRRPQAARSSSPGRAQLPGLDGRHGRPAGAETSTSAGARRSCRLLEAPNDRPGRKPKRQRWASIPPPTARA